MKRHPENCRNKMELKTFLFFLKDTTTALMELDRVKGESQCDARWKFKVRLFG